MRDMYWLSANVVKADEDKTHAGAFVASPTDPWGQSVPATTTHPGWTYREVFARDSYETFTGLLADGDMASARAMVTFLFDDTQQPDGSFPRNSLLNGDVAPDTFGLSEIDQDAYPLLMAWEAGLAGNTSFYTSHIRPDADFIVNHGPAFGVERWEEHPGYSPSTIAAEIAGLVAAAHLAQAAGDHARAALYLATADDYQRNVKRWTVTSTGPYGDGRYFIRLSPTGHPNTAETYDLGNGSQASVDQRKVIDAGFLELTRLGELPASDPDVQASLKVVDSVIESQTASGPGWHRYGIQASGSSDGYGDCYVPDLTDCSPTGAPWFPTATGSGHLWPLLDGERAEQDLQTRGHGRRRPAPRDHAAHDLRPRDGARAGLGGPQHTRLAVRLGPSDRVHRVRQRQARGLGVPADLGPGPVPPAGQGPPPAHRPTSRPSPPAATSGTARRPRCRCRSRRRPRQRRPGPRPWSAAPRRPAPRW